MDYDKTVPGWFARYSREGVRFSEHFADAKYGSPEASLDAAKEWHAKARTLLPPMDRREYARLKKSTNKSGIVGVYRAMKKTKGHSYWYWIASWTPRKGRKKFKMFSIQKHGEEGAKALAVQAREAAIDLIDKEWPEDFWDYRRRDGDAASPPSDSRISREIYGYEGTEQHRLHVARERDRKLREAKIEAFLDEHGDLFCEVCRFSFEKEYGAIGRGLIEIHHTLPLAQMESGHKTRLCDLICICSNCHMVVHNGDPYVNLQNLRFIYRAKPDGKSNRVPTTD